MNQHRFRPTKALTMVMLLCISLFTAHRVSAQDTARFSRPVGLDFAQMPNQRVSLWLNNGSKTDTIYSGQTNGKGKRSITADKRWKDYQGMACLSVTGQTIDFILVEDAVVIYCTGDSVNTENIVFANSVENVLLQSLLKGQKIWLNQTHEGVQTYAWKYRTLLTFLDKEAPTFKNADMQQKQATRNYIIHRMDMDALYTSGLWARTMDCIVQIYTKDENLQKDFSRDMQIISKRIVLPAAYREFTDFLDNTTYLNENQSKEIKKLVSRMKQDVRYDFK